MARKRTNLGAKTTKRIKAGAKTGATAKALAAELAADGEKAPSARTVSRRMLEERGPRKNRAKKLSAPTPPSTEGLPPLPKSADEIPETADLTTLDFWLARVNQLGEIAHAKGDLAGMGTMGRLATALLEAKRKATPPEKPDPNDSPDMRELADLVRSRLHKLVDQVAGVAERA